MFKKIFVVYLILINLISITLMYIDKQKAKNHKFRISEKTLMGVSILGGGIGTLWGMNIFRHKTKHAKFTIGTPLIIVTQALLILYFIK